LALANFGVIPFGKLYRGSSSIDTPINACTTLAYPDKTHILLAERGDCPFVTKARNAQNAGYKALIIVDSRDEKYGNIVLHDNGAGDKIKIPVMMIS
jgi:hypothetical protein